MERPGFWASVGALLRGAFRRVRAGGVRLLALLLISQLLIVGVALPIFRWLFAEALRAGGMHGLDLGALGRAPGLPVTFALIIVIATLAFWLISIQFTALIVLLGSSDEHAGPGARLTGREFARAIGGVIRKLVRPSSLPLLAYLFLLLPLTGFGFTSVLASGIAIPPFVSGELAKSALSGAALTVFLVVLAFVNLRLALTMPLFVLTDATGGRAQRASWRLTRGLRRQGSLLLATAAVVVGAGALTLAILVPALAPTAIADEVAPDAAPAVAAFSLAAAEVCGLLLSGLATALVAGVLIEHFRTHAALLPPKISVRSLAAAPVTTDPATAEPGGPSRRGLGWAVTALALVMVAVLGAANLPVMQRISEAPQTLVLAHRGFSDGGVENTIGGLEAAAAAGADLVEMDVMETKDGQFVAMHDSSLSRLAGIDEQVKNLTLAELTAITVHDMQGHSELIPSFADYVTRAKELGMPLLIEIKLGGADTPDHVDRLVAELEELDALDANIYHSLDAASVERLKRLRPDLGVGYTMAFAAVDVPDTPADFVVIEQWTATEAMQQAAARAGLGFFAWTVNDVPGIREHLRRNSDGIVTDHPDVALSARTEMQQGTGLADALVDLLNRFVTVV